MPQPAFLLSIVGLSVSLAGFSGLVSAFRRGSTLRAADTYRLRQIPEMALPTGFIALVSLALADSTGNASLTIRIAGGAGLLFTIFNALVLIRRLSSMQVRLRMADSVLATILNLAAIGAGVACVAVPSAGSLEWLLALLIARPGAAFLLALSDVTGVEAH